jgi:hypothetical protein
MALTLDRRSFIDVLSGGQGDVGAAMLPPPEGLWGMPLDRLRILPGYDPNVQNVAGNGEVSLCNVASRCVPAASGRAHPDDRRRTYADATANTDHEPLNRLRDRRRICRLVDFRRVALGGRLAQFGHAGDHGRVVTALPARQCPGELTYCLLMLLVPDLGEIAGDLELHTLVQRDLPRTFCPDTFVKIGDRRAQHAGDLK